MLYYRIFNPITLLFFTLSACSQPLIHPVSEPSEYLETVQKATFQYFWDFAHPTSGLTPERTATPNIATSGGTGFGIMSIVVGVHRNWITREEAVQRLLKMTHFLAQADRFHGAWPHWLDARTGKVIPFGTYDNGGDLVETAYLVNGLLVARAYFDQNTLEEVELRSRIDTLWREVEWNQYVRGGLLLWHWSPQYEWKMNHPIGGYNECLITYVLALGSPTHPISADVYEATWKKREPDHYLNGKEFLGYRLPLGFDYGGPLFFAHYSYLSLDPRWMQDQDANYWQLNVHQTLINRAYCLEQAPKEYGYQEGAWGLTASDDYDFYSAHSPTNDNGTISPTAALSSFPYTPYYSWQALRHFYLREGNRLFGEYGFYDAYNRKQAWYSNQYLAIDQGPVVVMMENYRSGLIWKLGETIPELSAGLDKMGIRKPNYSTGFYQYIPEKRSGKVDLMRHPDLGKYVIDFYVANTQPVSLMIKDEKDGKITVLIQSQSYPAGPQQTQADLPGGVYTLILRQAGTEQTIQVQLR